MKQVKMTDHEFAEWLRKQDPQWMFEHKGNACEFYCHGKCVAVAIFDNAKCTRILYIVEE